MSLQDRKEPENRNFFLVMLWSLNFLVSTSINKYQYNNNIDANNWALQLIEFFHMHSL